MPPSTNNIWFCILISVSPLSSCMVSVKSSTTGGSFTGDTVIEILALPVAPLLSVTIYFNESDPAKLATGVYVK